jgi:hypothetical protein
LANIYAFQTVLNALKFCRFGILAKSLPGAAIRSVDFYKG